MQPGPVLSVALSVVACVALGGAAPAQRTTWELKSPLVSPGPQDAYAMAYDQSRGRAVMFVGAGETWEWTGFGWVRLFPSVAPRPRTGHAMAYDAARRRVVLFGGHAGGTVHYNDTWTWDGSFWSRAAPLTSPAPRGAAAMAYDARKSRIVLFGGSDGFSLWNDTWEHDGVEWIRMSPPASPAWRDGHAMAFDTARARTVLFGGNGGGPLADTWEYDGVSWAQRTSGGGPSPRMHHALAFDSQRNRAVLFGGTVDALSAFGDTWEWDGSRWIQPFATGGIAGLYHHAMAFDGFRRRVVLFGGRGDRFSAPRNETWEYSDATPAIFTTFGQGCGRNPSLAPEPGSLPWAGSTFRLRITNLPPTALTFLMLGFSRTSYFGRFPLPFPLDPIGMPGCTLFVSDEVVFTVTNQGGIATLPIAIPSAPTVPGVPFYTQAFAFDPGANPLGVIVSNAGEGVVGRL
jgi:hypothetical protein